MVKNRAVFLDRDGVINELVLREDGRLTSPHILEELVYKPKVQEAAKKLRQLGFKLLVVTNQPGIYNGDMELNELVRINTAIKYWLHIDEIYSCIFPERIEYKPGCGAFLKLIKKYDINPFHSFCIGDRWKDIVAGQRAKLSTIYVSDQPYECPNSNYAHIKPAYKALDLWEAAGIIEEIYQAEQEFRTIDISNEDEEYGRI